MSRDSTFTEHSLLKDEELVKLKVHRAKNTTKKEVLVPRMFASRYSGGTFLTSSFITAV